MLVAPTQRQVLRDLTESDGRFAVDNRLHYYWSEKREAETLSDNLSFDVVVCTQVAEYVPDVDRALSEAFRVLKPGGRTIFVATDWDAVVWHSENPERMALVMKSWEALRPSASPKIHGLQVGQCRI